MLSLIVTMYDYNQKFASSSSLPFNLSNPIRLIPLLRYEIISQKPFSLLCLIGSARCSVSFVYQVKFHERQILSKCRNLQSSKKPNRCLIFFTSSKREREKGKERKCISSSNAIFNMKTSFFQSDSDSTHE